MCVIAIDIGAGTQDILIYNSKNKLENAVKLVFPSPTKRLANKVFSLKKDIFINGNIMGGGPVSRALVAHIDKGFNVFIQKNAAYTISDDLSEVEYLGFKIVEEVLNPDIFFQEIDFNLINYLQKNTFENSHIKKYLIAVQDHGFIKGKSDRVTRFEFLIPFIEKGLKNAFFTTKDIIDERFTRWNSLKKELDSNDINDYVISDTAVIAALGALYSIQERPVITIDAGNGHTFAALIDENDNVAGFFEHHTTMMDKKSVWKWIDLLKQGKLTFDDIYNDGGHGAHSYYNCIKNKIPIVVTGPNRNYLFDEQDNRVVFAAPCGDMMITGPIGLLLQQDLI